MSVQICARTIQNDGKRKFLYFISVLYCPVFLIMEPGRHGTRSQFFCLVHLPTTDKNTGPSLLVNFSLMICGLFCNPQVPGACILTCRPGFLFCSLGDCFRAEALHPGFYCQLRSSSLCWQGQLCSGISTGIWNVSLCVWPNVIAPDNILPSFLPISEWIRGFLDRESSVQSLGNSKVKTALFMIILVTCGIFMRFFQRLNV